MLHRCIPSPNPDNQGFDRLADNHIGGHATRTTDGIDVSLSSLDTYIKNQKAAKLPYRVYVGPQGTPDFLYLYGPNGWGYQITG